MISAVILPFLTYLMAKSSFTVRFQDINTQNLPNACTPTSETYLTLNLLCNCITLSLRFEQTQPNNYLPPGDPNIVIFIGSNMIVKNNMNYVNLAF